MHQYRYTLVGTSGHTLHSGTRSLRSSTVLFLDVPFRSIDIDKRFFSCAAPGTCNSLPPAVINYDTLLIFKAWLKTHLFNTAYLFCQRLWSYITLVLYKCSIIIIKIIILPLAVKNQGLKTTVWNNNNYYYYCYYYVYCTFLKSLKFWFVSLLFLCRFWQSWRRSFQLTYCWRCFMLVSCH